MCLRIPSHRERLDRAKPDGAWRPQSEGPADGHGRIGRAERFIELVVQTLQRRGRMMFDVTPAKPRLRFVRFCEGRNSRDGQFRRRTKFHDPSFMNII